MRSKRNAGVNEKTLWKTPPSKECSQTVSLRECLNWAHTNTRSASQDSHVSSYESLISEVMPLDFLDVIFLPRILQITFDQSKKVIFYFSISDKKIFLISSVFLVPIYTHTRVYILYSGLKK